MIKKKFSSLLIFSLLSLFLIVVAVTARVKIYLPKNSGEWKEYKNYDCNYQLSYPANWIIKVSQYKNPCETNKEAKCIARQSVWVYNKKPDILWEVKKWLFHKPPGDIDPPDITTFHLGC